MKSLHNRTADLLAPVWWLTPTSPAGSYGSKQINRPTWEMNAHLPQATVIKHIPASPLFSCSLMTLMKLSETLYYTDYGNNMKYDVLIRLVDGHHGTWGGDRTDRERGSSFLLFVSVKANRQFQGTCTCVFPFSAPLIFHFITVLEANIILSSRHLQSS